ncbi:MAG: endo-1,4-beta-xylanase [Sphingobium sp.]|nr:endo-1,4-beta-xylanase [Sphingobium sp.]
MTDTISFDRRQMLTSTAGAAFALAGGGSPLLAAEASPVAVAARKAGMRFGSCFNAIPPAIERGSYLNPAYAALLERDCTILVPENEFKWQTIRPTADSYNFTPFDGMLAYAQKHGMAMRGHTLLWHKSKWYPRWLNSFDFGARPASEAERILTSHIKTLTGRYAGKIVSYDVVNEAIDPATGKIEETVLAKAFGSGEGLLDLAFHTARDNAPGVQLVYNDYMSWEPGNETHRAGVLKLLEGFKKRGTPVDALGIQSHIEMLKRDPASGLGPHDERGFRAFLDEVTAMGYGLVVTEFDVKDNAQPTDFARRDKAVADYARAYLDLLLSYRQLKDFLCWGLNDKYSWLQGFSPRDDKAPLRCCPYDPDGRPKPLYQTLADAFAARG